MIFKDSHVKNLLSRKVFKKSNLIDWNSKTTMWTQTYQLRLENFLSRKVFQKISKSKKTVWLIELSLCPLENQSSVKDLQQSLVQISNEYKLADIGTIYFKKSCQLFKRLIAIFNCRLKPSSDIGIVYLNLKKKKKKSC